MVTVARVDEHAGAAAADRRDQHQRQILFPRREDGRQMPGQFLGGLAHEVIIFEARPFCFGALRADALYCKQTRSLAADLAATLFGLQRVVDAALEAAYRQVIQLLEQRIAPGVPQRRSEEHTSELQSLMRIS